MEQDLYRILGVDPGAPDREIKRAYYGLASKLHPDKAKDANTRKHNEEELALVSAAYNVLKDPAKRREYDAKRKEASSSVASTPPPAAASAGSSAPHAPKPAPSPQAASASGTRAPGSASPRARAADLSAHRVSIAERAFAKGMQLFNAQNFIEAVPFFEAAVQNDESKAVYHMKLAVALIRSRGSYNRALEHALKAIEGDPYSLEYKLTLADIHETAGAVTAATKVYEEVLRWEPENATAKLRLDLIRTGGKGGSFFAGLFKKLTKK